MNSDNAVSRRRNSFLLVLTAWIWGVAFVAQSAGGDAVGPYTFNCIRSIIGGIVLLPVIGMLDRMHLSGQGQSESRPKQGKRNKRKHASGQARRDLFAGGIACGTALAVASNLQQMGLYFGSTAGKAGFLTACYILIVPVLGLFFHKKCGWNIWVGIAAAVAGLYLLCIHGDFSIQFSDLLLLLCALVFAVHIMLIDYFAVRVDGVRMACIQFFVSGILSAVPMFFMDMTHSPQGISGWIQPLMAADAWIPILYAGVLSCGAGYTLQIIGQQGVNPTIASLLMSLESVFSVLAGWVILGEALSGREILGCVMIFGAVVLAQLPVCEAAGSREHA